MLLTAMATPLPKRGLESSKLSPWLHHGLLLPLMTVRCLLGFYYFFFCSVWHDACLLELKGRTTLWWLRFYEVSHTAQYQASWHFHPLSHDSRERTLAGAWLARQTAGCESQHYSLQTLLAVNPRTTPCRHCSLWCFALLHFHSLTYETDNTGIWWGCRDYDMGWYPLNLRLMCLAYSMGDTSICFSNLITVETAIFVNIFKWVSFFKKPRSLSSLASFLLPLSLQTVSPSVKYVIVICSAWPWTPQSAGTISVCGQ